MLYNVALTRFRRGGTEYGLMLLGSAGGHTDQTMLLRYWRSQGHAPGGSAWRANSASNMLKFAEVAQQNDAKGYKREHESAGELSLSEILKNDMRRHLMSLTPPDFSKALNFIDQMEMLVPSTAEEIAKHKPLWQSLVDTHAQHQDAQAIPRAAPARAPAPAPVVVDIAALPAPLREHMERKQREAEESVLTAMPQFGSWA